MGKKIAVLSSLSASENKKLHISTMAEGLRNQGHHVDVYTDIKANCHSFHRLYRTFRQNRPSILHLYGEKACSLGMVLCRLLQFPIAITVCEDFKNTHFLKQYCVRGNSIFAANETVKNQLISRHICNSKRIHILEQFDENSYSSVMKVYEANINVVRPLDYMISGYYGRNNFGDNLTLNRLMEHLKDYRGTVLTCDLGYTDVPPNVKLVHRFNLLKIRQLMKQTKVFLFGSGSILQDATSNRSLFYYYFVMKMALRYHCKTMLYANGIGPINHPKNRKLIAKILKKIDVITLRDQDSIDLMQEICPGRTAYLTQDDAFSYNKDGISPLELEKSMAEKTVIGINFKLNSNDEERINEITTALRDLANQHQFYYLLIPYHLSQDLPSLRKLHDLLPDITELSTATYDPDMLIRYASCCKFQIVERLHGQIIASMLGQPFLPINYDPKTNAFSKQTGMTSYLLDHDQLTAERLVNKFNNIIKDQTIIQGMLTEFYDQAIKNASVNRKQLYQIIQDF